MDKIASVQQLIESAQNLLSRLQDVDAPEVQALQARLQAGIEDAQRSVAKQFELSAERVKKMTGAVVEYVQENPWVAVAAGTAIAVALLYIALSARDGQADD